MSAVLTAQSQADLDNSSNPQEKSQQEETLMSQAPKAISSVRLKRQITVKTLVTDDFRKRAQHELNEESKLADTQLQQLEAQYQYSLQQLDQLAKQGQNVQKQLLQLNDEAQQKRNQLASVKIQVANQIANLDKVPNGEYIVTGILESDVEVFAGDNLYEKLGQAEMLVEDGIVKSITG
ncbi:MAG: YlqD family protein [Vampirovibrionales bacterium]|nr:YlqD family protein [Vampirovibrionales bacterium]